MGRLNKNLITHDNSLMMLQKCGLYNKKYPGTEHNSNNIFNFEMFFFFCFLKSSSYFHINVSQGRCFLKEQNSEE